MTDPTSGFDTMATASGSNVDSSLQKPPDKEINGSELYHVQHRHIKQVVSFSVPIIVLLLALVLSYVGIGSTWKRVFLGLFLFRYVKLIVNTVSWCLAKPCSAPTKPTYVPSDVTVVLPTVNPVGAEFQKTVTSALESGTSGVIIVTVGMEKLKLAQSSCAELDNLDKLQIVQIETMSKRAQMCYGVAMVTTAITVFCDDHVFWPKGFLKSILAPFEDPKMGAVGTWKRVLRVLGSPYDFWNFLGCVYLERHNMEILATNRLDGGVFIISARTAAYRTRILQDPEFVQGFLNEYCFFGRVGPLNADDDNFLMRWLITNGWKMWVQNGKDALMVTTIDNPRERFLAQCMRWARTTWRSNPRSLLEGKVIHLQPWSLYATYISLFVNFAAIMDPLLVLSLFLANSDKSSRHRTVSIMVLLLWIFCSKLVKIMPHMVRNPSDIRLIPAYICFGYFHSWLKLKALLTFTDASWGSRPEVDKAAASATPGPIIKSMDELVMAQVKKEQ